MNKEKMGRHKIENGKKSKIVIDAAIQEKTIIVIISYFSLYFNLINVL